ncbi:hypothetical protein ACIQU4_15790 [Streptomyces sp. NPDC090741]|uniref:hypothetical protein n=1 Tax=Streptomyces sp. NPDC090741 TaxID=3365967 RepID=UPI0037F6DBDF
MANQHKEKLRGLRGVDDELWQDFAAAAGRADSDRSAELRRFIEWYVGRPGVEQPTKPPAA